MRDSSNMGLDRLAKNVCEIIEDDLLKIGIFHRIFQRCKTNSSVRKKINFKKYESTGKLLQDIIGIRIVFYFSDDLDFFYSFLKNKHERYYLDEMVDEKTTTEFKPQRTNLVFRIPDEFISEFRELIPNKLIDSTFEVQLRTVFSEGWHEIDHDLRYKFPGHWDNQINMSRTFNGILAALETKDWSIISLFNQLSYDHYKSQSIDAMIRTKFRLRFSGDEDLRPEIRQVISQSPQLFKNIFKLEREDFLNKIAYQAQRFPLTINNLVLFLNHKFLKDESLDVHTPKVLFK
ncbi:hypothetical protein GVN16_24235 [Emticicia sp. CRIBPO]|uniref:RelA/SpoT domain-containing protein n=1 Tax=Emticicia sp. CRIBPO TaxID=2683258 RepID=UPI001412E828|nr:RelA/SpoT domain-containing protein [Emticicia sp. CRIBPO]NBA88906.1 hypothetical protein [Emticicia sp. CRIBPO]